MSNRSEEINELALALAKAQGQIRSAPKDAKVGGKISYKYATLDSIWDACRKPLSDNGLAVVQLPTNGEGGLTLETILLHSSGQWVSSKLSLPESAGRMSELQAMGSALTYARRYMLGAIVGITTGDDDDGRAAHRSTMHAEAKNDGMTLEKLLANLDKIERIKGFYSKVSIMDCRGRGSEPPALDDMDGWRVLFVDARDHAFAVLDQAIEDGKIPHQDAMEEIEADSEIPADFR